MRPDPIVLEFGERTFTVRPLSLGQIRRIEPVLRDAGLRDLEKSIAIIQIALDRDDPSVRVEDLEVGFREIGEMVNRILRQGGMMPAEDLLSNPPTAQSAPGS